MDKASETESLELRILELEQKIEHLRFSRRVLLNLLEKVIMEQKSTKNRVIKIIPPTRRS